MTPDHRLLAGVRQSRRVFASLTKRVSALGAFLPHVPSRQRKQLPRPWRRYLDDVINFPSPRPYKPRRIEPDVSRRAQRPRPRAHPSPERNFCVPLEPPLAALDHLPKRMGAVLVVDKEPRQHVHVPHLAERLATRAQLDVVIRR